MLKVCFTTLLAVGLLFAQQENADRALQQTRAAEIERARLQKAAELQPEETRGVEHVLEVIEKDKILQRVFGGVNGWRVRIGGLTTYSGFGLGPEYDRSLWHRQAQFRYSIRGSTHSYYLMETGLDFPRLADDHVFANLYAVHYDFPRVDYYGSGPNTQKGARSVYRLENTAFETRAGVKPFERLRFGVLGRYLMLNVGPGHGEQFAHTDVEFTEATAPGIQLQSYYLQPGAFVQFDWRDHDGNPHSGGNYIAEFSQYNDVRRDAYSFNRLQLEAQQYIPFFHKRRVIALRGRVVASEARDGNRVPFYLQPTLGGPDDLRGYRAFRFYGNNSAVFNAEYRWEVFHGLDMALFGDAGNVYNDWRQINLRHLRTSYGFGFRFNSENAVAVRIDAGYSQEGFGVWLKFNNVF
jgi:hypothetical protein